jgi:hypothetical protein
MAFDQRLRGEEQMVIFCLKGYVLTQIPMQEPDQINAQTQSREVGLGISKTNRPLRIIFSPGKMNR